MMTTGNTVASIDKDLELKLVAESRFCKSCKNLASSTYGSDGWHCRAPENKDSSKLDVVTGEYIVYWKYDLCKQARLVPEACGVEGKWFVIKPPEPPLRAENDRAIHKVVAKKPTSVSEEL